MKVKTTLFLVIMAEAMVILLGVYIYGWNIEHFTGMSGSGFTMNLEGLRATTRFSGRLSLFIFSFIFLLYPNSKSTLSSILSENFYLVFAVAHGIHLIELLSYVSLSGTVLVPYRVAGGFFAYLLIFSMPVLYARRNAGKLAEQRFNLLGFVYIFYVWFVFFMTYVARLSGGFSKPGESQIEHRVLMGWLCVMLGIKIFGLFIKKTKA